MHVHVCLQDFVLIIARSSVARACMETIIFYGCLFSHRTFSDVGKPTSPKLFHTTWLSPEQNLCYTDFFEVPPKNGGRKTQNLHHLFCAKLQTINAVIL